VAAGCALGSFHSWGSQLSPTPAIRNASLRARRSHQDCSRHATKLHRFLRPVFLLQVSLERSEIQLLPAGRGVPAGKPRQNDQPFKPDIRLRHSTGIPRRLSASGHLGNIFFFQLSSPGAEDIWPFGVNGHNQVSANFIRLHSLPISDPTSKGGAKVRGSRRCHQPQVPPASSLRTVPPICPLPEVTSCCCPTAGFPGAPRRGSGGLRPAQRLNSAIPLRSDQPPSSRQHRGFPRWNGELASTLPGCLLPTNTSGVYTFPFQHPSDRQQTLLPFSSPPWGFFLFFLEYNGAKYECCQRKNYGGLSESVR